jgi:hypothetical protein
MLGGPLALLGPDDLALGRVARLEASAGEWQAALDRARKRSEPHLRVILLRGVAEGLLDRIGMRP